VALDRVEGSEGGAREGHCGRTDVAFKLYVRQRVPWHRPEDYTHMLDGLRKAGWQGWLTAGRCIGSVSTMGAPDDRHRHHALSPQAPAVLGDGEKAIAVAISKPNGGPKSGAIERLWRNISQI
jgi:hypothetical protein